MDFWLFQLTELVEIHAPIVICDAILLTVYYFDADEKPFV